MNELGRESAPQHIDSLIIAAGADHRSYQVLSTLVESGCSIGRLIIFNYLQRRIEDPAYLKRYESYLGLFDGETIHVEVDITCSETCIRELEQAVTFSDNETIAIDITCFTKPYFFILVKYMSFLGLGSILLFYTQPKKYRFGDMDFSSFRSSSGPVSVSELPSFHGGATSDTRRVLIVIMGFDGDLSSEIYEIVAPAKTLVINGFPSFEPKFKDISLINNERLVDRSERTYLSTSWNPFELFNTLHEIVRRYDGFAIDIAPLGNKPMALGACMFAIANPSVRIIYPFPEKYENVTTESPATSWIYRINL